MSTMAARGPEEMAMLKSLVSESLTRSGAMGRIKADLRGSVFAILQQQQHQQPPPAANVKLQRLKGSREGRLLLDMITELLEFFDLHKTLAVFTAETTLPDRFDPTLRPIISKEISLPLVAGTAADGSSQAPSDDPVLLIMLRAYEANLKAAQQQMRSLRALNTNTPTNIITTSNNNAAVTSSQGNISSQLAPQQQLRHSGTELAHVGSGSNDDLTGSLSRTDLSSRKPRKVVLDETTDVPRRPATNIDLLPASPSTEALNTLRAAGVGMSAENLLNSPGSPRGSRESVGGMKNALVTLSKSKNDLLARSGTLITAPADSASHDTDEAHTEDQSLDEEDFRSSGMDDVEFDFETEEVELVDFSI